MKSMLLVIALALCVPSNAQSTAEKANGPDCSGGWPTNMAFVHMKNAGLVDNSSVDFSKTKTVRLASQKVGKDLWRQVYHVTYTKKSGEAIEAIAVHDASMEECSMTGVDVYVISRHLGGKDN
jgi:hypothetical protein